VCGDWSLGGVILLDVDRDAMRCSETVILRWRTVDSHPEMEDSAERPVSWTMAGWWRTEKGI